MVQSLQECVAAQNRSTALISVSFNPPVCCRLLSKRRDQSRLTASSRYCEQDAAANAKAPTQPRWACGGLLPTMICQLPWKYSENVDCSESSSLHFIVSA